MIESKPAMQCLSGSIVAAIKILYGVQVSEEALLVGPDFFNVRLNKANLTFDTNVNDIILNYISYDRTVENLSNALIDKHTQPLIINLPVRYLKYAPVYATSKNLGYHHFVLLTSIEKDNLRVFDSYVPSNPIRSMSGEIWS